MMSVHATCARVAGVQDPGAFARYGVKPPRGVLVTGPPGTGKTSLAVAAAAEAEATLLLLPGPDLLSQPAEDADASVRVRHMQHRCRDVHIEASCTRHCSIACTRLPVGHRHALQCSKALRQSFAGPVGRVCRCQGCSTGSGADRRRRGAGLASGLRCSRGWDRRRSQGAHAGYVAVRPGQPALRWACACKCQSLPGRYHDSRGTARHMPAQCHIMQCRTWSVTSCSQLLSCSDRCYVGQPALGEGHVLLYREGGA